MCVRESKSVCGLGFVYCNKIPRAATRILCSINRYYCCRYRHPWHLKLTHCDTNSRPNTFGNPLTHPANQPHTTSSIGCPRSLRFPFTRTHIHTHIEREREREGERERERKRERERERETDRYRKREADTEKRTHRCLWCACLRSRARVCVCVCV